MNVIESFLKETSNVFDLHKKLHSKNIRGSVQDATIGQEVGKTNFSSDFATGTIIHNGIPVIFLYFRCTQDVDTSFGDTIVLDPPSLYPNWPKHPSQPLEVDMNAMGCRFDTLDQVEKRNMSTSGYQIQFKKGKYKAVGIPLSASNAYDFSKVDFTFKSPIFEGTYRIFGQKKMLLFDKLYVQRIK